MNVFSNLLLDEHPPVVNKSLLSACDAGTSYEVEVDELMV